jgi:uncharacterized membrane protein YgdD (TMEM256/DUF423 family)
MQRMPGSLNLAMTGLLGFLSVLIGAVGAHALKAHLSPEAQGWFRTAWEYQILHVLALGLGSVLTLNHPEVRAFRWAGLAWITGILLFSGSLYAVSLGAPHFWVHVTPMGGFSLMAGWLLLSWGAFRLRKPD